MDQQERLTQIARCMEALNNCVSLSCWLSNNPQHVDPYGATLGECDWLSELHYWIWEVQKELQDA